VSWAACGSGEVGLLDPPRDPEVDEAGHTVGAHHDVRGLDVAVAHPQGVNRGQASGDVGDDPRRTLELEWAFLPFLVQVHAGEEVHGQPGRRGLGVQLVDPDHVRVVDPHQEPGLATP
jgi:hypothetical protein